MADKPTTSAPAGPTLTPEEIKRAKEESRQARERRAGETAPTTKSTMGSVFKKGGKVGSASKRADGCAQRGKTRGKMV